MRELVLPKFVYPLLTVSDDGTGRVELALQDFRTGEKTDCVVFGGCRSHERVRRCLRYYRGILITHGVASKTERAGRA
jgi:hypothetical protein